LAAADKEAAVTGAAMHDADIWVDWSEGVTRFDTDSNDDAYENVTMTYGQEFWVNVAVRDRAGHTAYYTPTLVSTVDDTDSPTPGQLSEDAGSTAFDSFTVTWDAASDVDGLTADADLTYKVIYNDISSESLATLEDAEANGIVAQDWKKGITQATIDGLIDLWTYYVAVFVRDDEGLVGTYGVLEVETEKLERLFISESAPAGQAIIVDLIDLADEPVDQGFSDVPGVPFLADSVLGRVAVDPIERKIYWTDNNYEDAGTGIADGRIYRCNFDGSEPEAVITTNLPEPRGLAVDWSAPNRYLYWTDLVNNAIYRSPLPPPTTDADDYIILDSGDDVDQPRGIDADTDTDRIYWVQAAGVGYGYLRDAAGTDPIGTPRNLETTTGSYTAQDIAVDRDADTIYWTESNEFNAGEVRTRTYEGSFDSAVTLIDTNLSNPQGIEVDTGTGTIYWVDAYEYKLYAAPPSPGTSDADDYDITTGLGLPEGIALY
jgi:hypothetical protein